MLALAPMASITDAPYRYLMQRLFNVDVVISELISCHGIFYKDKKTALLSRKIPGEKNVGGQIFGNDAEKLAIAGRYIEDLGYDFVDINLGCPVSKVVNNGAGAALCRNVDHLFDTLTAIKQAITIPLTIKIRIGWDEDHINAEEIVARAKKEGIKWVAIHGRTRAQGYKGKADWDLMKSIARRFPNYIFGNGDIRSLSDYQQAIFDAPFLGIMIGRGILSHPWLFQEIHSKSQINVTPTQVLDLLSTYLDLLQAHNDNPRYILLRYKKMASWLSNGLQNASQFRRDLFAIRTDEVPPLIECSHRFFNTISTDMLSKRPVEAIYRGGEG